MHTCFHTGKAGTTTSQEDIVKSHAGQAFLPSTKHHSRQLCVRALRSRA